MSRIFLDSAKFQFSWFFMFIFFLSPKLSMTNQSFTKKVKNFQFQSKLKFDKKNPIWKHFSTTQFIQNSKQFDFEKFHYFYFVKPKLSTAKYDRSVAFSRIFWLKKGIIMHESDWRCVRRTTAIIDSMQEWKRPIYR